MHWKLISLFGPSPRSLLVVLLFGFSKPSSFSNLFLTSTSLIFWFFITNITLIIPLNRSSGASFSLFFLPGPLFYYLSLTGRLLSLLSPNKHPKSLLYLFNQPELPNSSLPKGPSVQSSRTFESLNNTFPALRVTKLLDLSQIIPPFRFRYLYTYYS